MLVVEYFHHSLIHSQPLVLRSSSKKGHQLPFRKTRRCQRYNNERGGRSLVRTTEFTPPWIQEVLEELTPFPAADQYEITKPRERAE